MAKEGQKEPGVSGVLLGVGGMTRGDVRGVAGMARQGWSGQSETAAAGHCNKTVPKPYLFGWKGDQLRAKAESPKAWNPMGGKEIMN